MQLALLGSARNQTTVTLDSCWIGFAPLGEVVKKQMTS
jgi:hypothetical protein